MSLIGCPLNARPYIGPKQTQIHTVDMEFATAVCGDLFQPHTQVPMPGNSAVKFSKLQHVLHQKLRLFQILNTGRFDFDRAHQHPTWFQELYGHAEHRPETEEYGIGSFVYRARRPFNPETFAEFIAQSWQGVVRVKGYFWLATRPDWVGDLSIAGALARHQAAGRWWASVPHQNWPDDKAWKATLAGYWDDVYGDRRQELVFIGAGMDEAAIRAALDNCLVPSTQNDVFMPWHYDHLADPFPQWA